MNSEFTPELMINGYLRGWFPMTDDDGETINWYEPRIRAVFPISGMHVSRSLARVLRSGRFKVTFDQAFEEVMRACIRPPEVGNWISEPLIRGFVAAHLQGWAHSCEVWSKDYLVGGTYGIAFGGAFCAESMFHRQTDASKVALFHLIERCRELGFVLFDAQLTNPHLETLGMQAIPQSEYLRRFRQALAVKTVWGLDVMG